MPVGDGSIANRGLPNSRLEVFEDAGHFPQLHIPARFAHALIDFIESTEPTQLEFTDSDFRHLRKLLLRGTE